MIAYSKMASPMLWAFATFCSMVRTIKRLHSSNSWQMTWEERGLAQGFSVNYLPPPLGLWD